VFTQIVGVRRDCFGCGHTCISCKELFIRQCKKCGNEYCREDNEASSEIMVGHKLHDLYVLVLTRSSVTGATTLLEGQSRCTNWTVLACITDVGT
jgi:hypothetical protein